eukprot:8815810-Pyramimonas_sp.AAC.1
MKNEWGTLANDLAISERHQLVSRAARQSLEDNVRQCGPRGEGNDAAERGRQGADDRSLRGQHQTIARVD